MFYMSEAFTLSLKKDISFKELDRDRKIILESSTHKMTFDRPRKGLRAALQTLYKTESTAIELKQLVQQADGLEAMLQFHSYLKKFINLGWICHSVLPLATAIPLTSDCEFSIPVFERKTELFTLSRFAYLHQVEGRMVLESPLSHAKVILLDWRSASLVAKLSQPQTFDTLVSAISELTLENVRQFLNLLLATQMVSLNTSSAEYLPESENTNLAHWEFHDLLFHSRSRQGRHDNYCGDTYRFLGKTELPPVVKPKMSKNVIELYKTNIDRLSNKDIPLTRVLEERRSIRNYHHIPITERQLGEFLYRTARVKNTIETDIGEISIRPYPSGGGMYELELYPVINTCKGISSGLYHYDPLNHQLYQLTESNKDVDRLIKDAWYAGGQQDLPQVVIVISARFQRLSWKYKSIAYSLILKHVGVLYQTMYLVATSMSLSPCALGWGNSDLFTRAAGVDYYAECSVGEFALGSKIH